MFKASVYKGCRSLALLSAGVGYVGCDSSPPVFVDRPEEVFKDNAGLDPLSGDATAKNGGTTKGSEPGGKDDANDGLPKSSRWTFLTTEQASGDILVSVDTQTVEQRFALRQRLAEAEKSFVQVNRPMGTELFEQGSESDFHKESFQQEQAANGLLDIVLVVDNSGSMKEEQQNLSTKLLPLLSYVSDSDWRIGVVTTDPRDGCLRGLISKNDSDPAMLFAGAVTAGTGGTSTEQGIYQAVAGIKGNCSGATPWVRANSTLAVLFLTDEDNCSDGTRCGGDSWSSASYLTDYLASIRQIGVNARVYGLFWHPSMAPSECATALRRGSVYAQAIAATNGAWGSICEDDYTGTLQSISQDLSVILKSQFALTYTPNLSAGFQLRINGNLQTSGYRVVGNVLEFTTPPPANAKIDVAYYVTSESPKDAFALKTKPVPSSLEVYLDGQKVTEFTYDESMQTIRFSSAPVCREVKVSYRIDQPLAREFNLGSSIETSSIYVRVDGKSIEQGAYSFDPSTGNLRFEKAPSDGAKIVIAYDIIEGPELDYQAFVPEQAMDSITIRDATNGRQLHVQIKDRMISFLKKDWALDRSVILTYSNPYRNLDAVDIGFAVLADSLLVRGESSGKCDDSKYSVSGEVVDYSTCGFASNEAVYLSFDYISRHETNFALSLGQGVQVSKNHKILVYVNGERYADFSIEGHIIKLGDLPYFSEVTVELIRGDDD